MPGTQFDAFSLKKKKSHLPHNSGAVPKLEKQRFFFLTRKRSLLIFWNYFSTFLFSFLLAQHFKEGAMIVAEVGRRKTCHLAV